MLGKFIYYRAQDVVPSVAHEWSLIQLFSLSLYLSPHPPPAGWLTIRKGMRQPGKRMNVDHGPLEI